MYYYKLTDEHSTQVNTRLKQLLGLDHIANVTIQQQYLISLFVGRRIVSNQPVQPS